LTSASASIVSGFAVGSVVFSGGGGDLGAAARACFLFSSIIASIVASSSSENGEGADPALAVKDRVSYKMNCCREEREPTR